MNKKIRNIAIIGLCFWAGAFTEDIISLDNTGYTPTVYDVHPRMVSYEYLTTCPICGDDKMEGYYSLVDGYRFENCKTCFYYVIGEANGNMELGKPGGSKND